MTVNIDRRRLLQSIPLCAIASCARPLVDADPWRQAQRIVDRMVVPTFPDRRFSVTDYGAVANSAGLATAAFRSAIEACHAAGGGTVHVPAGVFRTGAIHLLSNVNLHLHDDAVLRFSTRPEDYLPAVFTRWEGVEYYGYSPLIYAWRQENIAVTGGGVLDGQASNENWWEWARLARVGTGGAPSSRDGLFAMGQAGSDLQARQFSSGHYLRPPLFQPYACTNVLVEGVTVNRSPFWLLHPVLCENVTVRGVHLQSLGPNSDGCNPESCRNVLIENCFFDTGDDCIAIKSGRNNDGRRVNIPSENIVIRDCQMRAGHGGIVMGSEISGGVRHVYAENNVMSSPDLERGFRIKTNSVRGGVLENIYVRNTTIGEVREAIVINFFYEEGDAGQFDPLVRNVEISNLSCEHAETAFSIRGFERAPVTNLRLIDIDIEQADAIGVIEQVRGLRMDSVTVNHRPVTL